MLATRNDYEVAAGTFENAVNYFHRAWRNTALTTPARPWCHSVPAASSCEKAAIHMKAIGIERVFQLEGGILKYVEEVGGVHYHGDCSCSTSARR